MENLRGNDRGGADGLGRAGRLDGEDLFEAVSRAELREIEGGAALLVVDKTRVGGTMGIRPVDMDKILSKGGMQQF